MGVRVQAWKPRPSGSPGRWKYKQKLLGTEARRLPHENRMSKEGGRFLPSFPLDQLKASRSEKENRALVVEAATEQWDWW